jgi:LAGLIDADG endonuclease
MLLTAGTTSIPDPWSCGIKNFKYTHRRLCVNWSNFKVVVTKLKLLGLSANSKFNILLLALLLKVSLSPVKFVISETLCNNNRDTSVPVPLTVTEENIKKVSVHSSNHFKPLTDEQFGHYLAGLIDGDGHFSSAQQLVIVFNSADASLAYFIKDRLGHGTVRKVKNKNAVLLVVGSIAGITTTLQLIKDKLRVENKLTQINNNILAHKKFLNLSGKISLTLNKDLNLDNFWLAGFSDADASFQVKVITRETRKPEIRLNFQVDQKTKDLLVLIKNFLGGNIGYRSSQDTYYYGSTSFGSAKNVINYFDKYPLQSSKHTSYLKWRKVYLIVQNREHLTLEGIARIKKLKENINR